MKFIGPTRPSDNLVLVQEFQMDVIALMAQKIVFKPSPEGLWDGIAVLRQLPSQKSWTAALAKLGRGFRLPEYGPQLAQSARQWKWTSFRPHRFLP